MDFEKLIPIPDSLRLNAGMVEEQAISCFLSAINPANPKFGYSEKLDVETFGLLVKVMNEAKVCSEYQTDLTRDKITKLYHEKEP